MSYSANDILKEFRSIRNNHPTSLLTKRPKKRRNETDREYIFRAARYRCEYCKLSFPEKELHAVRKHPQEKLPLIYDGVCACGKCAKEKGGLTHDEFLQAFRFKKRETRKEAYENGKELNKIIFEKYHYTCIYCMHEYGYMPKGRKLTKDHKIPISRGGTNDLRNIACSCRFHNLDKGSRTAEEYFKVLDKRKYKHSHTIQ